ncbi:restriction endonuclease subunit S domain-containing protein [Aquimarina algicola]|uniref:Type I restriction modification DNA specificity domain-containing protein n=1 Tax=Aquimarina algicola TaxID=2589995 RepID=A0A504IZ90_9FLAO|nr:hypothetical protein [Aquimarina algicola]TPN83434.1 hypothetical protein FHK87_19640 [Aquimarina algicola]
MSLKFRYVPLTFITDEEQIKAQIKNTIILKYFFDLNNSTIKLNKLIEGTQYGYNASALKSGTNKFLRISDITDGKVDWESVPYCDCSDEETYLLEQEDLLIARTGGTTGKSFLITNPQKKSVFAGYLIRIRANENSNPEFLNLFLNSYVYWSQVTSLNKGEFRPSVNASKLKALLLPKCNEQEQLDAIKLSQGKSVNGYKKLKNEINKALLDYEKCKEISKNIRSQNDIVGKLKQSILQDAIQGKLTEDWRKTNKNIEPASELLKQIKAEKAKLIKEKKIKKEKPLPKISKEEIPFEIPENWDWIRLGNLCSKTGSGKTPRGGKSVYIHSGIKFIRSQNVYDYGLILDNIAHISESIHLSMKSTSVQSEDLLLNITGGSIGRCCVVSKDFDTANINQHVAIIRPIFSRISYYLHSVICSPYFQSEIIRCQTGAGREGLPKGKMDNILIPFPSQDEQEAIIEKIDGLKARSESLKHEIAKSETNAKMLVQAVLKEAFESNENKGTKVIALPTLQDIEEKHFVKRKMLASYIINKSANDEKFGDTKFEKLLYLADYHILKRNFGQEYKQKTAGPYDNKFTYAFFQQTIKAGWFYKQKLGNMNRILPGDKNNKSQISYDFFSNKELQRIGELINKFISFDYKIPEIISTLYAVWNNRIIRKQEISDEYIKQDFLNWDKGKAQYVYPKDRVAPAIKWMKENGFVPDGWGKIIEPPKNKTKKKK